MMFIISPRKRKVMPWLCATVSLFVFPLAGKSSPDDSQSMSMEYIDYFAGGTWESQEVRTLSNGKAYKMLYDIDWVNKEKSVASIRLEWLFEDGSRSTFLNGYYTNDPMSDKIFYFSVGPNGLVGRGGIEEIGDQGIVLVFDGWAFDGTRIIVRDDHTVVDENNFHTLTRSKVPGGEWETFWEVNWLRKQEDFDQQ